MQLRTSKLGNGGIWLSPNLENSPDCVPQKGFHPILPRKRKKERKERKDCGK